MRYLLDASTAKKDSGLTVNFNTFYQPPKLTPTVLAAALSACATETVHLNSERIETRFGSYGIEVLASEAGLRRSSLYSADRGVRTCRTYAVVRFTEKPHTSFCPEHAKVLAGNSLGEVFKAHGWSVYKQTLHIGSLDPGMSNTGVNRLMRLSTSRIIALHVYQLLLAKDNQVFEYATIAEAHHPDYLPESELLTIYPYDDSESLSAESLSNILDIVTADNGE